MYSYIDLKGALMKDLSEMTLKQRHFFKELIATGLPTEAAMRAYDCKDRLSARNIASENLAKLGISMSELMDQMGLGLEEDIELLKKLRAAKKVVGYLHQYKKDDKGKTEKLSPDEVISNEFLEVEDLYVQLKALELSLKIKGQLKDKTEHSFDDGTKRLLAGALKKLENAVCPNTIKKK